jgi:TolB-like protein/class 3 adenylate cyclase/Tfp pilus assembly protein PilF
MVQRRIERKLAAVFVADVAGYSRLMELDEEGTHARLSKLQRELVGPQIREHHGRIIKNTGDGVLAEFASVVDAVRCAVEMQREMIERNAGYAEDRRTVFRIGINLGDVIVMPDDIYGDGVNVAARLEGLAEPGGVCISGTAYDQVRDKVPYTFAEMGEQAVKNMSRPIRVYALGANALAGLPSAPPPMEALHWSRSYRSSWLISAAIAAVIMVAGALWLGIKLAKEPVLSGEIQRLSIVVLPFANLSGNPAEDYFADVITEGLTTALSRIKGAFVIARSTAFTYKGKPVNVKQVGKELDVRYALEGSAQYSGGKVRVNAQLIDAETGAHLWADQFDADRSDMLEMQDEIVTRLTRALTIQYLAVDIARVNRTRPGNLDAQDLAMRCGAGMTTSTGADWTAASSLCDRALQIDGRNVLALGLLAISDIFPVVISQSSDPRAATRRADELASRAIAIDPNHDIAHLAKAMVLMAQNRHEEAIVEAERSLALNPSNVDAYNVLGAANLFLCRPDRTIEFVDKVVRLSPRDPYLWSSYQLKGEAFFIMRQNDRAIEWTRRSLATGPTGDPYAMLLLVSAFALNGQQAEAVEALKAYLANSRAKSKTIAQFQTQQLSLANNQKWLAYNEQFAEGLRKAGLPE